MQFLSLGPGDPSTPGTPSVKGANRLPIDPANGFPTTNVEDWEKQTGLKRDEYFATIPSLPISYEAARPILEALGGPSVPDGWQGGLPLTYHVGPGPVEVHFTVGMDYQIRTIWNVIATLKGQAEPDRWVMIGNHRDAWVHGAVDPSSGTAATLEACRALGEAVKNGWKPRRSIVYASWDAEEYGLVGSTEWAEEHADELNEKAVLMLNVDSAVSGKTLDLDGVPSLRELVLDAAGDINDPRTGKPLRESWIKSQRASWAKNAPIVLDETGESPPTTPHRFSPQMNPLGSGSDYTAFVDHLGIPATDINFTGTYGVYHSIYDNFFWMENFCDPEFITHATAAKLYTLIAMRAAGAEVVPLRFVPYADAIRGHVDDLRRIVARKTRAAEADEKEPPITFHGLTDLLRAVETFDSRAEVLDRALEVLAEQDDVAPERLARLNDALTRVERAFLLEKGLPERAWFKHSIYAPGLTTGYASWPLPGIHQAILEGDQALFDAQWPILVERIEAAAEALKSATDIATGASGR